MADSPISQTTKSCTKCGEEKPATLAFFYRHPGCKLGLSAYCADCIRAAERTRQSEARRIAVALRPAASPTHKTCAICQNSKVFSEFRTVKVRAKYLLRPECRACAKVNMRAYLKKKYAESRQEVLERNRVWRKEHSVQTGLAGKRWKAANPDAARAMCDRYRAKRHGVPGSYTKDDVLYLLKVQQRLCKYCGEFLKLFHVDHFIPLSRGGSNYPDNLVLSCPPCNYDKKAKMPWEWRPDLFSEGCSARSDVNGKS